MVRPSLAWRGLAPALARPGLSKLGMAGRASPREVSPGVAWPRLASPSAGGDGSLDIFVGSVRDADQGASQTPAAGSRAPRRAILLLDGSVRPSQAPARPCHGLAKLGLAWPGSALACPGLSKLGMAGRASPREVEPWPGLAPPGLA